VKPAGAAFLRTVVLPVGRNGSVGMLLAAAAFAVSVACTASSDGGESSCAYQVKYGNRTYSDKKLIDRRS
jgi:hypothetical protein